MDTSASKSTQRNWSLCLLAPIALFITGCNINVTDLTPSSIRANPSNVYTITAQINVKNSAIVKETLRPEVIIDGQAHPMSQAPGSGNLYEYDFRMPIGRSDATYYILVQYQRKTENGSASKEIVTELNSFSIENRYSVELEVNRAPIGTRVAVLGRGFTREDKIMVGEIPAATRFASRRSRLRCESPRHRWRNLCWNPASRYIDGQCQTHALSDFSRPKYNSIIEYPRSSSSRRPPNPSDHRHSAKHHNGSSFNPSRTTLRERIRTRWRARTRQPVYRDPWILGSRRTDHG
jgi:hypothetical protein